MVDISADGLLVPGGFIRQIVSASELIWFISIESYSSYIMYYPRFENYNNFWLVKTPGIQNPYSRVFLGHITGCN
jgi:hypothetical protein